MPAITAPNLMKRRAAAALTLMLVAAITASCRQARNPGGGSGTNGSADLLIKDWDTGDGGQWDGILASDPADQFSVVDRFETSSGPNSPRQGSHAARFVVAPGDKWRRTSGERCEANLWNYEREAPGSEYYYGWSTLFPEGWVQPAKWGIIMQWHAHTDVSPPIAFNARGNSLGVTFSTGDITGWWPAGYEQFHEILKAPTGPTDTVNKGLSKGLWHDFIVHVKFTPDRAGTFKVWHRLETDTDFTEVLSLSGIPTLQWSTDSSLFHPGYAIPHGRGAFTSGCWIQHGLYRGETPPGGDTNTVYHDNWCRGRTFQAVRDQF